MKSRLAVAAFAALASVTPLSVAPLYAAPGTLTVDAGKPGVRISPHLYGIFFEEINYGGDGGLYAELLRNRNFEESDQPDHWKLVLDGAAQGDIAIGERTGSDATEFNKRHLTITHEKPSEVKPASPLAVGPDARKPRVGAACDGYWGIPVGGEPVTFTVRWRGDVPLTATVENASGVFFPLVASVASNPGPDGWTTSTVSVSSDAKKLMATDARLVLSIDQPGSVEVDYVSLMRPNAKATKSPVRQDLADKLLALEPAFMRFPGGCWVEGETMATASRWKRTIGPLHERWTQPNLWGYQSPNGLGYHEYLQLSEDLNATAMFVCNVGMSHKEVVPMNEMGPWVQDALDAIEYAIGDASTTWGKRRAEAGHPEPFRLDYVEIGNENGGPAYDERYALFYDAIKAKYPTLKTIACDWQGQPKSRPIEILDEHYYKTPQWFFARQHMYDTYPRDGYKVYVGEYAVTQGSGAGNLISALGEAAFMTGMERNSDVVVMSSYAPLFTHVDGKRWNPDLINFDNARSYGTPSYHVQQMFAANRGDVVLPVKLDAQAATTMPVDDRRNGSAGVATWQTRAEFKDFEVLAPDGTSLLKPSLANPDGWFLSRSGDWQVVNGVLAQRAIAPDVRAVIGDRAWTDYSVRTKARKLAGQEGFILSARVGARDDYVWFNVGGWGNTATGIERSRDGDKTIISAREPITVETGRWYDLRLDVRGETIEAFIDGKRVATAKDVHQPTAMFAATASRDDKSGDVIVKVVNGTAAPQELNVNLSGVASLGGTATATVLTGDPQDENTLDAPAKVAPMKQDVPAQGSQVPFTFPKHSVTILRVPAK